MNFSLVFIHMFSFQVCSLVSLIRKITLFYDFKILIIFELLLNFSFFVFIF